MSTRFKLSLIIQSYYLVAVLLLVALDALSDEASNLLVLGLGEVSLQNVLLEDVNALVNVVGLVGGVLLNLGVAVLVAGDSGLGLDRLASGLFLESALDGSSGSGDERAGVAAEALSDLGSSTVDGGILGGVLASLLNSVLEEIHCD